MSPTLKRLGSAAGSPCVARGPDGLAQGVDISSIPLAAVERMEIARQAFFDFGKGRHKVQLNFGDCFAYALSKALDEPMLFKGSDFVHTDVKRVHA